MTPVPPLHTETLPDGTPFDMVFVEGDTFMMGSETGQDHEKPIHEVQLDSFYMGRHLVTQRLWKAVTGSDPDKLAFPHPQRPVERVSWDDCQAFLTQLNEMTGKTYLLPTEAQWEYAARGGKYSRGLIYAGSDNLREIAWYRDNSQDISQRVGRKRPNELGLYDLSGNVREWCQDWYDGSYYKTCAKRGIIQNPGGPENGESRVVRGGSWIHDDYSCRVAHRFGYHPDFRLNNNGLRLSRY